MTYKLTYFKEAKTDIVSSKRWYFNQRPGLEKRFADDIKQTALKLAKYPYSHSVRYKNIRIAHPDVFPYSIHYFVDEDLKRIVIIGIVHTSRDYSFLYKRI